jgi:hypothetical protein
LFAAGSLGRILGQKHDAGGELTRLRQLRAEFFLHYAAEKLVRQGRQNTSPIAGVWFATASTAVVHIAQDFFGINENLVAALAFDVRNKSHSARIVLEGRVV